MADCVNRSLATVSFKSTDRKACRDKFGVFVARQVRILSGIKLLEPKKVLKNKIKTNLEL